MRRRTFVTLITQFSGLVVNALTLGLLSRKLGPENYSIYVTCVAMVTIVGTFTRGNQTQVASVIALRDDHLFLKGDSVWGGITRLIFAYMVFWIALIPIFSHFSKVPIIYLLISSVIIVAAVLGSVASGVLQGLERFEFWQWSLGLVTFLQVPLVLLAVGRTLSVGYFLLVLSIPSFTFFIWVYLMHKDILLWATSSPGKSNVVDGIVMGLFILMLQTPIISLRHLGGDTVPGSLESLCLIGIALSGLASIFGSYLLPTYARKKGTPLNLSSGIRLHIIHSIPLIGLVVGLTSLGPQVLSIAFGDSYSLGVDRHLIFLATASYITWSIAGSLLQERISKLEQGFAMFLVLFSLSQLVILRFGIDQPEQLFLVFLLFGFIMIGSILLSTSKDQRIS